MQLSCVCKEILDGLDLCILSIDNDYRITSINRAAEDFLEVSRSNVLGMSIYDAFPDAPDDVRFIERTLNTGQELRGMEVPYIWGGFNRYLAYDTYILRNDQGEQTGALITFSDITETKHRSNRVMQSSQVHTISRVVMGLAHELKNPLLIIQGYLEMYLKRRWLCPRRRKVYTLLSKQVKKSNNLMDKFVDIYRPSYSNFSSIKVKELVDYVVTLMGPMAIAQKTQLDARYEESGLVVKGDRERLEQVLINLIKNSMEAFPLDKGGSIEVVVTKKGNQARILVKDNGCGISKHNMPRLGIPFFTSKDGGTGIGLALSWSIIDQHGGSIQFDSHEGKGTTVAVYLPCSQ